MKEGNAFAEEIAGFISYLNLQKRASALTTKVYQTDIAEFFCFLETETHQLSLTDITFQHVRGFIAQLMDSGLSPRSVNRKLSSLKSFFKYLLKNQLVNANPAQKVKGLKIPKLYRLLWMKTKPLKYLQILSLKKVLKAFATNW